VAGKKFSTYRQKWPFLHLGGQIITSYQHYLYLGDVIHKASGGSAITDDDHSNAANVIV